MTTTVSDYRALISGFSWWGASTVNKPTFVTYSFETAPYSYLYTSQYSDAFRNSFRPLTEAQKAVALASLKQWDDVSGIHFLEVAPGQGDIRFATYDLSKDPSGSTAAGYASYPSVAINGDYAYMAEGGGDVFLDDSVAGYSTDNMTHVIVHELGHAIGLKHPFDGDVVLKTELDNTDNTVMSYTGYGPKIGPIDIAAVQHLYGGPGSDGTQVASWSWNAATDTLTQTGFAGADTIRGISTADIMFGAGGNDILFGGLGSDRLDGGADNDVLYGDAGNDVLAGSGGNDTLRGGDGNDTLDGGEGDDTLWGENGDNTLRGGAGSDRLNGGDGRDRIEGGDGTDSLFGGGGGDALDGGAGDDTVSGYDGNDAIAGGGGNDNLYGGSGNDVIGGGSGTDSLVGDVGDDRLAGESGNDFLYGGAGNDTLVGGTGDDYLNGEEGIDTADYSAGTRSIVVNLSGASETVGGVFVYYHAKGAEIGYDRFAGIENVMGSQGADDLTGNSGDNLLDGRGGADRMAGGAGNDTYAVDNAGDRVIEAAGQGRDTLVSTLSYALAAGDEIETLQFSRSSGSANLSFEGNAFAQTLIGNAGANKLNGGLGNDTLTGKGGADTFVFTTALGPGNVDHITDFAAEDTFKLAKGVFKALTAGTVSDGAFKVIDKAAVDADDRLLYKQATGELFYDADGSGKGAAVLFAVLDNKAALTHADFVVA